MAIHQTTTSSVEEFFDEHVRLTGLTRELEDALRHCSARPASVSKRIDQFFECLLTHFQFEEDGGYFTEAMETMPHFQSLVDRLAIEHREFIERARELHEHARLCDGGELWWEQLRNLFDSLVNDLQAHEKVEYRLVRATFQANVEDEI